MYVFLGALVITGQPNSSSRPFNEHYQERYVILHLKVGGRKNPAL
jgi:hypothetical protein